MAMELTSFVYPAKVEKGKNVWEASL